MIQVWVLGRDCEWHKQLNIFFKSTLRNCWTLKRSRREELECAYSSVNGQKTGRWSQRKASKASEQLFSKSGCSKKDGWVDWYDRTLDVERNGWSETPPPHLSLPMFFSLCILTHWALMSPLFLTQQHGTAWVADQRRLVTGLICPWQTLGWKNAMHQHWESY